MDNIPPVRNVKEKRGHKHLIRATFGNISLGSLFQGCVLVSTRRELRCVEQGFLCFERNFWDSTFDRVSIEILAEEISSKNDRFHNLSRRDSND